MLNLLILLNQPLTWLGILNFTAISSLRLWLPLWSFCLNQLTLLFIFIMFYIMLITDHFRINMLEKAWKSLQFLIPRYNFPILNVFITCGLPLFSCSKLWSTLLPLSSIFIFVFVINCILTLVLFYLLWPDFNLIFQLYLQTQVASLVLIVLCSLLYWIYQVLLLFLLKCQVDKALFKVS